MQDDHLYSILICVFSAGSEMFDLKSLWQPRVSKPRIASFSLDHLCITLSRDVGRTELGEEGVAVGDLGDGVEGE